MDPQLRTTLSLGRLSHYYSIMQTTILGFVAVAALLGFGAAAPVALAVLAIVIAAFGILAGNAALADLKALVQDLDEATRATHYGRSIAARNLDALKLISTLLIALTGLVLLLTALF